ncbi:NfeD family protein [bacterium]|nr:NfeD family protein [bacterium]
MLEQISPTALWAITGIILIIIEVFTGTFAVLFFGLAALLVAALKFFGLNNITLELIIFGLSGLSGLLLFRKKFAANFGASKNFSADAGHHVVLNENIVPGNVGTVDYQGTKWTVVNADTRALNAGEKVVISKTEGTKLFVTGN